VNQEPEDRDSRLIEAASAPVVATGVISETDERTTTPRAVRSAWRRAGSLIRQRPLGAVGFFIVLGYFLLAVIGPLLAPYNPTLPDLSQRLMAPSMQHLFGTDSVGLDVFSRILYGARIDMFSAVAVVVISGSFGTVVGMAAAWAGGWWDELLMRLTDMFLAFPGLILAMAIAAILSPSLTNALLAIGVTYWPIYARIGRGQALAVTKREYIEAARVVGSSPVKILFRHIMPNSIAPVVVQATLDTGAVILLTAGLSFIGFGAQPPTPEWGAMISAGREYVMTQWWVAVYPAIAILLLVMGFNLLGDALRDEMDPRMRDH
jgi:peptide/nickel transport system permease protein